MTSAPWARPSARPVSASSAHFRPIAKPKPWRDSGDDETSCESRGGAVTESERPAWSAQFQAEAIQAVPLVGPLSGINRDWAWGGSTGRGVRVAVIDSGVDHNHPAVGDSVGTG